MAPYDILMVVIFAASILFGLWKGLAWQVASLAAVVASYFVAIQFRQPLLNWLKWDQAWGPFAAMLILYVATSLAIWLVYGYIRQTIKQWHLKEFDRQAGALLGAVKGALLCMVLTMFAVTLLGDNARRSVVLSRSGGFIAKSIHQIRTFVPDEIHGMLAPYFDKFEQKMNEPLPPPSSQGWQGQFSEWIGRPASDPTQGFRGSFSGTPSSAPSTPGSWTNPVAPGVNVHVDTGEVFQEVQRRFSNRSGN